MNTFQRRRQSAASNRQPAAGNKGPHRVTNVMAKIQHAATVDERGFSLAETLVAMTIMLIVLAGTLSIMADAIKAQNTVKGVLDMNGHLRASMDLMQRDMLQVGQGLPVGRRVGIPNDAGSTAIIRPGPAASTGCAGVTTFPIDSTLPAVSVGPGLGPRVNGVCTDVITTLAADNMFGPVPVAAISANGSSLTIHNSVSISDNPDVEGDNLRPGDLLMLTKGAGSVLMQVTAVAGQEVTFGTTAAADPLRLNQLDAALNVQGTINQLKADVPVDPDVPEVVNGVQQPGPSQATRIRMITYFVNTTTTPNNPRLVRVVGGGQPNVVGFGVQALSVTYDIADQGANPTGLRMNAADLDGSGACAPDPCSENQIRKVNIVMAMRTEDARTSAGHYGGRQTQNTLFTQVSLRSMAFVDRYR